MLVEITFIRHGQTTGNAAGRWQGHTNSSLTATGREQAERLAKRLADRHFDLVVSSDLDRAVQTASALGRPIFTDERWREPFFGDWENLTTPEIMAMPGDGIRALMAGEDIALGGGERLSEVLVRTRQALDAVIERLEGNGKAAVVSHGLALLTFFAGVLETKVPSPLRLLSNTSIAELTINGGRVAMPRYNDDTHLTDVVPFSFGHDPDDTEMLLIRHGQTNANLEQRWQGHSNSPLTEEGERQSSLLAESIPPVDAIYASPLDRAAATAAVIAERQGLDVTLDDRLREISFGAWEGLTTQEIQEQFPEEAARFFGGEDLPRGGSGETFDQVRERMRAVLRDINTRNPGRRIAVVSHGGASRAWATEVLGLPYAHRHRLPVMRNTGYARITFGRRGPSLVSWNLAPHLGH